MEELRQQYAGDNAAYDQLVDAFSQQRGPFDRGGGVQVAGGPKLDPGVYLNSLKGPNYRLVVDADGNEREVYELDRVEVTGKRLPPEPQGHAGNGDEVAQRQRAQEDFRRSELEAVPEWDFKEWSVRQRRLDDAREMAELQARLRSQPMQYIGPIDDAANARAAMEQQRTANNLAAALGGPFVAAPMMTARVAGLDEYQVEQAGMLGLSAMDAAGLRSGVGGATRLASGPRRVGGSGSTGGTSSLDWSRVSPRTGGDAAEHVMLNHGSISLTKPNQGVFYSNPVATIDDAWAIAQQSGVKPVTVGNRDIYVVPRQNSGYAGGMGGQLENFDHVTIITERGTTRVVTGYPSGGTPPLPKGYNSLFGNP